MPPITFRSIAQANNESANKLRAAGVDQINAGIDSIIGIAKGRAAKQEDTNTANAVNAIRQLGVGETQQAIADGTFDPVNLSGNIDTAKVQAALQGQEGAARAKFLATDAYNTKVQNINDQPLLSVMDTAARSGEVSREDLTKRVNESALSSAGKDTAIASLTSIYDKADIGKRKDAVNTAFGSSAKTAEDNLAAAAKLGVTIKDGKLVFPAGMSPNEQTAITEQLRAGTKNVNADGFKLRNLINSPAFKNASLSDQNNMVEGLKALKGAANTGSAERKALVDTQVKVATQDLIYQKDTEANKLASMKAAFKPDDVLSRATSLSYITKTVQDLNNNDKVGTGLAETLAANVDTATKSGDTPGQIAYALQIAQSSASYFSDPSGAFNNALAGVKADVSNERGIAQIAAQSTIVDSLTKKLTARTDEATKRFTRKIEISSGVKANNPLFAALNPQNKADFTKLNANIKIAREVISDKALKESMVDNPKDPPVPAATAKVRLASNTLLVTSPITPKSTQADIITNITKSFVNKSTEYIKNYRRAKVSNRTLNDVTIRIAALDLRQKLHNAGVQVTSKQATSLLSLYTPLAVKAQDKLRAIVTKNKQLKIDNTAKAVNESLNNITTK